jgi:hypothetical protein
VNDELTLRLDDVQELNIQLDGTQELVIEDGAAIIDDYNLLRNKPQINGVELIGNKLLADLFPDGIIVDGGSAEGVI